MSASNAPRWARRRRCARLLVERAVRPAFMLSTVRLSDISGLTPTTSHLSKCMDAASAAIYGAEAGKRRGAHLSQSAAKPARGKITYDFQYTSERVAKVPKMLNAEQYISSIWPRPTPSLDQMLLSTGTA